jgi:hypothetical protein
VAGASGHVFHRILTIQSLKGNNAGPRSPKLRKAPISFVVSARPSVRLYHCGSHRQDLRGISVTTFTKNLSRNLQLGSKRKTTSGSKQVHSTHPSTFVLLTAVQNILEHYEIFYRRTKYFTGVRNILQQYEIFYSTTTYFTAV